MAKRYRFEQELKEDLRELVVKYRDKYSRKGYHLDGSYLERLYDEIEEEDRVQSLPSQGLFKLIKEKTKLSKDVDENYESTRVTLIDFEEVRNYLTLLIEQTDENSGDNKALLPIVRRELERLRKVYDSLMEKKFKSPYSGCEYSYYSRDYLYDGDGHTFGSFYRTFGPLIDRFKQTRNRLLKTLECVVDN